MSSYSDVPEINMLYVEQENIASAISLLDNAGTVSSFTVAPTAESPTINNMTQMSVSIGWLTSSQALNDAARAALVSRYDEITQQLADLGVTEVPADATRGR